ncbi:MAG: dipeptidyl carboxypeptidase II, partial [Arenibacter latericius]|nr:dipeptidyl carboxypeptidase II [Arenibacter latericius]
MKKASTILMLTVLFTACNNSKDKSKGTLSDPSENPLLVESNLPYYAPDFIQIKNSHFKPALLQGIAEQKEALEKIANNPEAATFDNTILALEKSDATLNRVRNVFYALTSAHTNDTIQAVQVEMAPKFAELRDAIYLNDKLFQRVKSLYETRESLELDAESLKLLENYFEDFEIAGANLPADKKETLRSYNSRLATLTTKFNKTLLEANNAGAMIFTDKSDLAGLSEAQLKGLENEDGEGWKVPLQNTTQQPLLQAMENR